MARKSLRSMYLVSLVTVELILTLFGQLIKILGKRYPPTLTIGIGELLTITNLTMMILMTIIMITDTQSTESL